MLSLQRGATVSRAVATADADDSPKQHRPRIDLAATVVVVAACVWAAGFGYLAVVRHLAGGSHAEDLGFTDQVLWNFLRGQWFRISIYDGATWNTELDIAHLARPDSLLAFHVEPMLLLLVPLYALGGGAVALLVVQAVAVAAGAIPAFRLGNKAGGNYVGLAVAAAYLLSPLGQWAVLSDFHTSTLAAPLLLLAVERVVVGRAPSQALIAAAVAMTAREDVAPAVAILGAVMAQRLPTRRIGVTLATLGVASTILSLLVLRSYSGGISPFDVRYGAAGLAALARPTVRGYATTLLLSGGWLGLFAPLAFLPALPSLALNALSTSTWMAAGKAHYSGLVLPFLTAGTAAALARLADKPKLLASAALLATSTAAYVTEGAGLFAVNYAPAAVTSHADTAAAIAASLPADAAVSASTSLVPHLTHRPRIYVFPAINDADYVFLDLRATAAPTSPGDVYLRVRRLLDSGGWQVDQADDGLLLLDRAQLAAADATQTSKSVAATSGTATSGASATAELTPPNLLSAALVPSADGSVDVDGPHWILRTTWQTERALPPGTRLEFAIELNDGESALHVWDVADLWWNPPERWAPGQPVTIDVPDVPLRHFNSWSAHWSVS